MLSRRIIYFVDNRVYFRCHCFTRSEYGGCDIFHRGAIDNLHIRLEDSAYDFARLVKFYSRRTLTYQTDALNAMKGIARRVSEKMHCRVLEGIPCYAIEEFLLFRRANPNSHLRRRQMFPSYSWTGWMGALEMVYGEFGAMSMNHLHKKGAWIDWYCRLQTGEARPLWMTDPRDELHSHDIRYGYVPPSRAPFSLTDLFLPACNQRTEPTHIDLDGASTPFSIRPYHLLQFWTLSVFFELRDISVDDGTGYVWDSVDNISCGLLYLDGIEDSQLYDNGGPDNLDNKKMFEMILLSPSVGRVWSPGHDMKINTIGHDLYLFRPAYSVMLLEWMGKVAERRGVGFILQSAVLHSLSPGPVWKENLLG